MKKSDDPTTLSEMRARRRELMVKEPLLSGDITELCELDQAIRAIEQIVAEGDKPDADLDEHETHLGCGAV